MSVKPEPDSSAPHVPSGIAPPIPAQSTAPGPPVDWRDTSLTAASWRSSSFRRPAALQRTATSDPSWSSSGASCNPFNVDLVMPFDITLKKSKGNNKYGRAEELKEIRDRYEELVRALEGVGARVATKCPPVRKGKGGKAKEVEEVWVFVGVEEDKMRELVDRERALDAAHNLPLRPLTPPSPATRIRLAYTLLTAPTIQHGLGITPAKGQWERVKSIAPLHDEERDREWVRSWSMGKGEWGIGLWRGLEGDTTGIAEHRTPPVHLYFDFLTTYTLSLLPLSFLGALFYLFSPTDSYPPLFALVLSLYSTIFVSVWRVRERKLAVRWGYRGCESMAVGRLRPEYVANLAKQGQIGDIQKQGQGQGVRGDVQKEGEDAVDMAMRGDALKRDVKGVVSVLVIAVCGVGLGGLLMSIFVLEAFVAEIYEGPGKEVVPLLPTALFALVVPRIVGAFQHVAKLLVDWEDHATPGQAEKSLTAKTFAMNAIVAYLGLFLSAYVYVPFGPFIMANIQQRLARYSGHGSEIAQSAEKAGLGPRTEGAKQHAVKAGRLKGQLFAYTVTNQVINAFLELGLPYILRFVDDWRAGRATIKDALHGKAGHVGVEEVKRASDEEEAEKRFLEKVEFELSLPEYTTFTDYAEMVTQFGYIVVWSCVWPLAPVFALLNNYFEIRGDVVKITQHVRRPVGDRVETIGSWLDTLSILSWLGAVVSSTLIYLFRPSTHLVSQSPNPSVPATGNPHLHSIISTYSTSPTFRTVLPTLIPLIAVALAASHAHIALRWTVERVCERVMWRGSAEEGEVGRMNVRGGKGVEGASEGNSQGQKRGKSGRESGGGVYGSGFWNGAEEGAREIARVGKVE